MCLLITGDPNLSVPEVSISISSGKKVLEVGEWCTNQIPSLSENVPHPAYSQKRNESLDVVLDKYEMPFIMMKMKLALLS